MVCALEKLGILAKEIVIQLQHHKQKHLLSTCVLLQRRQWHPTLVPLPGKSHGRRSLVGCSPRGRWGSDTRLSDFIFPFHFHALEKEMATHSSVLGWRIPGTGEPCGLPSMGSHRVEHDWSDLAAVATACLHEAGGTWLLGWRRWMWLQNWQRSFGVGTIWYLDYSNGYTKLQMW